VNTRPIGPLSAPGGSGITIGQADEAGWPKKAVFLAYLGKVGIDREYGFFCVKRLRFLKLFPYQLFEFDLTF